MQGAGSAVGRSLARLAAWSANHPKTAWLILVLPTLALLAVAARTPVDLSFAGLMDREHPEVQRYFQASRAWGLGGRMPLLLDGPQARLDEASDALVVALEARDDVRSVRARPPTQWLEANHVWLVSDEVFEAWREATENPSDPARVQNFDSVRLQAEQARTDPFAAPGRRLLLVTLSEDPLELGLDAQAFPAVAAETKRVLAATGVQGRYAGMPAIVEQDQATTLARIAWLSPLSLGLALLLLAGVERRIRGLLAIAAPMICAAVCTVSIVGALFGRITLMEALFGVIVFGLGVDFAVHLGLRARDEQAAGASFSTAVQRSFAGTGPGVVAGALTTAGAFALAATAPEPTFVHLGVTGSLGIVLCLGAMLVALPAAWASLGKQAPGLGSTDRAQPSERAGWGGRIVGSLSRHAARHPWSHLVAAAVVLALGFAGLTKLTYETDLRHIVNRDLDAVPAAEKITEVFGIDPMPWVFVAEDLARARTLERELLADPNFSRVESATRLLGPSLEARARWLDENRPRLEALAGAGPQAAELVEPLLAASAHGPPAAKDLPRALRDHLVAPDGGWLVYAFSDVPHMDARRAATERAAARAIDPSATSMVVLFEVLIGTERPWVPRVLLSVLAFVLLVLVVDLRRPRWILLSLVPVSVGTVVGFGLLGWAGVHMNTVTVLAAPLVLGLGVDDGIHVVHRLRELGPGLEAEAAAKVGRAIALTTATTCASFAALVFSGHPGMSSMAWVMLSALPLCLVASVSTLTAVAVLTGRPPAFARK